MKPLYFAAVVILSIGMTAREATAQTRTTSSVVSGGATAASNGTTMIAGTVGQPVTGLVRTSTGAVGQGFWYAWRPSTVITRVAHRSASEALQVRVAPNPVSEFSAITVDLPRSSFVSLALYDASGARVAQLLEDQRPTGRTSVHFSAVSLASGHYTVRLVAGPQVRTVPVHVIR